MRRLPAVSLLLLLAMPGCGQSAPSSKIVAVDSQTVALLFEQRVTREFVPGEVVVKMKPAAPGVLRAMPSVVLERFDLEVKRERTSGGETVYRLPPAAVSAMTAADARERTLAAVRSLAARADVEYAQPNYVFHFAAIPNDPAWPQQWHYFDNGSGPGQAPGGINLPTAWNTSKGSAAVVVAVIDTGILPNHEDIAGSPNRVAGYDMISDPAMAGDGDGRDADATDPGDAVAANECYLGSPALPSSWHGTHVAGTVGVGRTDNGVGVAGVNWNVKVQPVRVLGKCGGTMVDINDAIRWAAGLAVPGVPANPTPARVINLSLGGTAPCSASPATQAAINDAIARGVTVVAAAGNEAADAAGFIPASCNGVITVAAGDRRGYLATRYSNFGARIDLMAPGGDVRQDSDGDGNPDGVLSMVQGGYAYYNGTSMAAPHVAGVAALLLAADPGRTPEQIRTLLKGAAMPRTAIQCPKPCGAGLLNANVTATPPPTGALVLALAPPAVSVAAGKTVAVTASVTRDGVAAAGASVSFASSNPAIAAVSPASATTGPAGTATATVTGVAAGSASVQAQVPGASASAAVTVTPKKVPALPLPFLALLAVVALLLWAWRLRHCARR